MAKIELAGRLCESRAILSCGFPWVRQSTVCATSSISAWQTSCVIRSQRPIEKMEPSLLRTALFRMCTAVYAGFHLR